MKLILVGHGRMGKLFESFAASRGCEVVFTATRASPDIPETTTADAAVDFSHPLMFPHIADYVRKTGTPLVCGTTGYSMGDFELLRGLAKFAPVAYCVNFSVGIEAVRRFAELCAPVLTPDFDARVLETHHRGKLDMPSGTAKMLLAEINKGRKTSYDEREICSLRGGNSAGEHTMVFLGNAETVTVTHTASSREIFAAGALRACERIQGREKGFYTFSELMD